MEKSNSVELIFEEILNELDIFGEVILDGAIKTWLEDENIIATKEDIMGYKIRSIAQDGSDGGVTQEAYMRGRRYIFEKIEDAVLFKFRWITDIDFSDEYMKEAGEIFDKSITDKFK